MFTGNCDALLEVLRERRLVELDNLKETDGVVIEGRKIEDPNSIKSQRGSRFRGVSKNGKKWQVSKI